MIQPAAAAADSPKPRRYDVVIVGGGLVGASLAVALETSGLSIAVMEPRASRDQPSFDERTVALTYLARQIYTGMGVWAQIAAHQVQPILEIHISDRGHFGMTHLRNTDVGVPALGYVVATRVLGEALHQRLRQSAAIDLFCPAEVERVQPRARDNLLTVCHRQQAVTLQAGLVVLADGGRSNLGAQIGVQARRTRYPQNAILCFVQTDRPHGGRAYERFTGEGPLALLPHCDHRYAVVWSTDRQQTAARMALSDTAFMQALQRAFGARAGNFSRPSARNCYPLHRSKIERPVRGRALSIGNAAHIVHPVAGQGFNLGLRDVAVLAEMLHQAAQQRQDIASPALLERYVARRRRETAMVGGFTDGLIQLFCSPRKSVQFARNIGLAGVELLPPIKRLLLRHTLGLAASPTRLGAGLPLA